MAEPPSGAAAAVFAENEKMVFRSPPEFWTLKLQFPAVGSNPLPDTIHAWFDAKPLRIEYPGAIYQVLSRGDRREAIFRDDADRKLFLDLLAKTCRRTSWQIHAYCLMGNRFHLVVETPRSNLSAGIAMAFGFLHSAIQSPAPSLGSSL